MSVSTKFLRHPHSITVISAIFAGLIRLIYATNRKTYIIDDAAQACVSGEQNAVITFWHGRIMMMPKFHFSHRPVRTVISMHRDGLLISRIIGRFGHTTISGSTSRGGKDAVQEMLRMLAAGDNIGITPDGPRGPNQKVQADGAITVARRAGVPVVPITISASRCIRLGSWDRFMVILPFGRIVMMIGAPIWPDKEEQEESLRALLEQRMNEQVAKADGITGA